MQQKNRSNHVANIFLQSERLREYGYKIKGCADTVSFTLSPEGEPRVSKIFFCREKYCPTCAKRRSLKAYASGMKLFGELHNDFSFLHLVLTVKNCSIEDLRETIQMMNRSSTELFKSKLCKGVFKGVLRCLEISVNFDKNEYHPHFHCLVAVNKSYFTSRKYIPAKELRKLWADLIGQTDSVIHIGKIKEPDKAVAEICKYCVKPFDITDTEKAVYYYERLYFSTKHLRYTQSYGVIRNALKKLRIDFEDMKLDFDGENFDLDGFESLDAFFHDIEYVFAYNTKTGRYRLFFEKELTVSGLSTDAE